MKKIKMPLSLVLALSMSLFFSTTLWGQNSFYDIEVLSIDGKAYDLEQHRGQKILVVNTASKCGLTPQYEDLQKLYEQYGPEDFVILGFPSNDFAKQEPGSNEEIAEFCSSRFQISFPMMAKIRVKGEEKDPMYAWLTSKELNGVEDSKVGWNFQKYMIDEEGRLIGHLAPQKKPFSKEIVQWLEK